MTMRLDLTRRYDDPTGLGRTLISPTPYGCGDCGRWFATAWALVQHVRGERSDD